MSSERGPNLAYDPALDGVRALAILAVLAFHARIPGLGGGFVGVDLFFVLSGFLITRLLLVEREATGTIALRAFWGRRLRRLYPALLTMLLAFLIVVPWAFSGLSWFSPWVDAVLGALYLTDLAPFFGERITVMRHLWSLAVEERFYLIWPLLILVVLRKGHLYAMIAFGLLFLALAGWRHILLSSPDPFSRVYYGFDTHSTGLVLGCMAGIWRQKFRQRKPSKGKMGMTLGWVGLVGWGLLAGRMSWGETGSLRWGLPAVEACAALVVLWPPEWLAHRWLVWGGRLSYGWYLWHYPIIFWMRLRDFTPLETLLWGGGTSLVFAAVSYFTVESWFRCGRAGGRGRTGDLTPAPQTH